MIYGVVGFIRLLAGEYMVVITDRTKIGRIGEHDIFKLKDYKVLPLSRNNLALSEAQTNDETTYISLLHSHLQSGEFHFSYTYEFTHTLQRQSALGTNALPLWKRADERFFWNMRLQSKFIDHGNHYRDQDLSNFILPIVNGFAEIKSVEINNRAFTFALFSRRSRHRAGTRYFSRGIDAQGNVSNFNETEQIVVSDMAHQTHVPTVPGGFTMISHVQTRGSIPVFWAQINNIKYTPKLQVFDDPQTETAFRRHFDTQKRYYGPQLVINLINKKGYEGPMGAAFSKQIAILSDPQIKYFHFDFHQECSKMRWHRVSVLLDHFRQDLVSQGQLQDLQILAPNEQFETSEQFESLFRNVWADNADVVSCAYSGTGALKTDFTRTGRRTKAGALQDLQNSIVRYVKNNFLDGARQDAYDLFLLYDIQDAEAHPFSDHRPVHLKVIPLLLVVGFAMLVSTAIIPETIWSTHVLLFISFWIAVMVGVTRFILMNGIYYVNWPHLIPLGYDLPVSQFIDTRTDEKLGTAEVELGWKNE
ncbi:hypothetical protein BGZ83_002134 [Gryganskiella cystojenkinii]|nr:hypothetical protein BGZ83_002134 [Gryganskiella cystojenkinii]